MLRKNGRPRNGNERRQLANGCGANKKQIHSQIKDAARYSW